ncbi:MAG: M20/M25/M40 family metallo-hydrolase, partial [Microbacterium sp.]|uniref:M20/M25/M40 family metallo-hydrolase n=1 Tax=Microbacterium sp. TaxID=51671 RepID=UPI0039E55091
CLADAARAHGIDPARFGRDEARLADLAAFVELHVEQGRWLADTEHPVALATGILAHGRWRLAFAGEGNHAGATPMGGRHDPMVAAAATIEKATDAAAARDTDGAHARATVGRVRAVPGGTNVIASRVEVWLDVRGDTDADTLALQESIAEIARDEAAARGCTVEIAPESWGGEVVFDPDLLRRLHGVLGGIPAIPTGAGHDAGVLAAVLPTAMLFVRNPTGVSHAPSESASDADIRAGADALTAVLRELAGAS